MRSSASARLRATLAVVALAATTTLAAQGAGQAPDYSKVEIKTTKIAGNFYTLDGQGGRIGVLAGPDGVLMVDTQFAPLGDKIIAAVKQISNGRIRFVINTHVHGDHTGGNENLAKTGATIFAREELRGRLAKQVTAGQPTPPAALPVVTYDGPVVIHMDGEDVQIIPIRAAHTDGDTMVRFPAADVIMTGDFYRSAGYPNIDRANGGTLRGMIDGLNQVIDRAGPSTKIIPGHGDIVDKTAVTAHRDMIVAVRDKVAALVRAGKNQQEVIAAKPTSDFDAKVVQPGTTAERFVGQVYAELGGK